MSLWSYKLYFNCEGLPKKKEYNSSGIKHSKSDELLVTLFQILNWKYVEHVLINHWKYIGDILEI